MPTLITDEFESYFVEEICAKVEDIRGCMPIASLEKMDLEGVFLKKKVRINIIPIGPCSSFLWLPQQITASKCLRTTLIYYHRFLEARV